MSVHDLYPAQQWRNQHRHHDRPRCNRAQSVRRPHPAYHRPPRPRYPRARRRASMPLIMGPRTGLISLINLFSSVNTAANNANSNPLPPRPPSEPQQKYPAFAPHNNHPSAPQPLIIDILKSGTLDVEYNVVVKYYRTKYFELKSDSKLYYFASAQDSHKKADGAINLLSLISLKKVNATMFEMEVNNKCDEATSVDIIKLLTPDTTVWRFKCNTKTQMNDWFDCIRCFVSPDKVHMNDVESKEDDWCVLEKTDDGIVSKMMSDELDLDITQPDAYQPGMDKNKDEYIPPPALAMGNEGNNGNDALDYGDEGKVTYQ